MRSHPGIGRVGCCYQRSLRHTKRPYAVGGGIVRFTWGAALRRW